MLRFLNLLVSTSMAVYDALYESLKQETTQAHENVQIKPLQLHSSTALYNCTLKVTV